MAQLKLSPARPVSRSRPPATGSAKHPAPRSGAIPAPRPTAWAAAFLALMLSALWLTLWGSWWVLRMLTAG